MAYLPASKGHQNAILKEPGLTRDGSRRVKRRICHSPRKWWMFVPFSCSGGSSDSHINLKAGMS